MCSVFDSLFTLFSLFLFTHNSIGMVVCICEYSKRKYWYWIGFRKRISEQHYSHENKKNTLKEKVSPNYWPVEYGPHINRSLSEHSKVQCENVNSFSCSRFGQLYIQSCNVYG